MSKKSYLIGLVLASLIGAVIALGGYKLMEPAPAANQSIQEEKPVQLSRYSDAKESGAGMVNFVDAAELATPAVVHIRSTYEGRSGTARGNNPLNDMFRDFFGAPNDPYQQQPQQPGRSSGSGVIISKDGYIVTNNHVIDNADVVEVTLYDNRSMEAEVIGIDPTTDLALIKVDASSLPYLPFGNSDNVRVGEWVLAVGNPFDLNSTVTAGIVSAKARNINILRDRNNLQIESFIQTDAAVNPGNSGGALVNLNGELIGINTAIATPTGTYAGYSFAVPVSLVKKVMDDLLEFGEVQRGLLGISIIDVNAQLAEAQDLDLLNGVYINSVNDNSAAAEAGLEPGDVIIAIDGSPVSTTSELQEKVALNRPGDEIEVTYIRNGSEYTVDAVLKNRVGTVAVVERNSRFDFEGAEMADLDRTLAKQLGIDGGVQILGLGNGKFADAGIGEGFIIVSIDKQSIRNINDLRRILERKEGGILIEGYYPDGERKFYGLGW